MPVITNQQLNTLKGGGRELFPALCVDLNQSSQEIVELSITVMFTGLHYGLNKSGLNKSGLNNSDINDSGLNINQSMQLNLTSNVPNIDDKKNLHAFVCPAIDNELKIFHCNVQFEKCQKSVSITPILNTSRSTIEGIENACGHYIISYL
ncbi:hypothetical protein [Shewanella surugensis]|uniref:Uncharacterized protein n=1 Tax=Shewanella surugensis TaxID=212020 RepID=A0ABT0LEZ6_9GAMM|nr:hypothetical protein [Shewanella surugensis]MCL1126271.1 hypothetical protein [Shewanella surugensis]